MADLKSKASSMRLREGSVDAPQRRETNELTQHGSKNPDSDLPKFPFDLTNLMSLQFDNLRAAIEYLAR